MATRGRPKKNATATTTSTQPKKTVKRTTAVRNASVNKQDHPGLYVCACCGKNYTKYEGYFPKAKSEIWAGRDCYLPICKTCLSKLFLHYKEAYGDEKRAIRRLCMMFDIYYQDSIVDSCENITKNRAKIHAYISKTNLVQYQGENGYKTFDTTLDEEDEAELKKLEIPDEIFSDKDPVPESVIERWGAGLFERKEYRVLEDHYRMLHKNNPNIDSNQEIFVKTLCQLNLMMMQAMKTRDYDMYAKINDQYSKTFSKAGLKTVEEKDSSNNEAFGVTLAMIAQTSPEEFYKDKNLWKDFDNIGEYYDRFVKRPMENLMTGTNIRDTEFYVPEDDSDE